MVETSLIGVVLNGLSHLHNVRNKAHFAVCLIHGLGGNLNEGSRETFAKEVKSLYLSLSLSDMIEKKNIQAEY